MAHYNNSGGRYGNARFAPGGQAACGEDFDDDEDDDSIGHDRIRRNYLHHHQNQPAANNQNQQRERDQDAKIKATAGGGPFRPETIEVKLNEGYFASERKAVVNLLANCRQKCSSMQMFNPAKNQSIKEQQQNWNENEKYTLDSLNEIKGTLDEQFQWTRPEDGREVWPSKLQYFMAITSYSIGLGNVIRFPILVQKNGGLAFIIPFVIMLIVEGIPLFYLELAVGQRMRKAAISCWNMVSPFAAGIGIASAAVSFVIGLYYNTMVAWTLLYLWGSATRGPLPFASCPTALAKAQVGSNIIGLGPTAPANSAANIINNNSSENECQRTGPFEHYWYRHILQTSEDADIWTNFNWPVSLCLLLAWLISYVCLLRGLSASKRIVYVASTFPYVILTIFFFKAANLKGMSDGVYYLFAPDWSKLADPYVWLQSAAQVFFSLGLGFGGLIALSSYNPVNNNCYRDAVKVSLINFLTSIYAGVVIFAILGYKAHIGYDKCMVEREQTIDIYMSDYYLRALNDPRSLAQSDDLVAEAVENAANKVSTSTTTLAPSILSQDDNKEPLIILGFGQDANSKPFVPKTNKNTRSSTSSNSSTNNTTIISGEEEGEQEEEEEESLPNGNASSGDPSSDYFDSEDAIESMKNIDNQLVESNVTFDYHDEDVSFIINASNVISESDLKKIIEKIPGLVQCSVKRELEDATRGTGLVFVVMAEAISHFSDAPLWATVFFLMLFTLGLDSQFGNLEGLLSSVADLNFANSIKRQWITGFICCISLIISVFMFAHSAGSYMFAIFDEYAGSFSLVFIALFELIAISYIYGLKRFCDDCELMTGKRPPFLILLSWRYISPILLLVVILTTIREFSVSLTYEAWVNGHLETKAWPSWCIIFGACLIIACVIWIPLVAILRILKVNIIPEESLSQCWFPAEELREYHDLQEEHKVTKLERVLFGFRSDDD